MMSSDTKTLSFCLALLQFRAYSHACLIDAGSNTITVMFQAGKERRMHSKKEEKSNIERESQINKPKFVIFQGFFFPEAVSEASVTSH